MKIKTLEEQPLKSNSLPLSFLSHLHTLPSSPLSLLLPPLFLIPLLPPPPSSSLLLLPSPSSPSDNRILDGVSEGVAEVEGPGDVGWRQSDHKLPLRVRLCSTLSLEDEGKEEEEEGGRTGGGEEVEEEGGRYMEVR